MDDEEFKALAELLPAEALDRILEKYEGKKPEGKKK